MRKCYLVGKKWLKDTKEGCPWNSFSLKTFGTYTILNKYQAKDNEEKQQRQQQQPTFLPLGTDFFAVDRIAAV